MKIKLCISVLLLWLLSNISHSQAFYSYGFKTGLASSYLAETETIGYSYTTGSRFGVIAGVFSEFFKAKGFSVMAEINFEQKGGNDLFYSNPSPSLLNLLSVPILAKLTFQPNKFHPYIALGPRADFLLSKSNGSTDYKNINPINFGISVSVGFEIDISHKTSLLTEAAFSPDLTTWGYTGGMHDYTVRNMSFEFRLGLKFNR
jgi:hypothetical protein